MYAYPWPIGTCRYSELPINVQTAFSAFIVDGYVSELLPVHRTATEGPYVDFGGYKVRVIIETISSSTFRVKLA